jgi:hypothetical protein
VAHPGHVLGDVKGLRIRPERATAYKERSKPQKHDESGHCRARLTRDDRSQGQPQPSIRR